MKEFASNISCQLITTQKIQSINSNGEHGPWSSDGTVVADIELLSRANYFIGSSSTRYIVFFEIVVFLYIEIFKVKKSHDNIYKIL
jgi:hypothetical protein